MVVYTTDYMEVEYHPAFYVLEVRWTGILNPEVLTSFWHKIVELAREYIIKSLLLDASHVTMGNNPGTFISQVPHYFTQPLPLATIEHLTKIARVISGFEPYDQAIARHYTNLQAKNHSSFRFRNFAHYYEAMDWLIGGSYQ